MVYVIRGDPTRDEDLERIADAKDKGSKEAGRVLESVYRKSRDEELTEARKHLINAHREKDVRKSIEIENQIRDYEREHYGR